MQGSIGLDVGLTIFGNDLLAGISRGEFWPGSSVFVFCKSVEFAEYDSMSQGRGGAQYASNPAAWVTRLKADGVRQIRLHYQHSPKGEIEDRMLTGFVGGGGEWLIEALREHDSDYWRAAWRVGDGNDPEKKIWKVTYYRVSSHNGPRNSGGDTLEVLTDQFDSVLVRIADLAHRIPMEWAEKSFLTARSLLKSNAQLLKGYYSDAFDSPRLSLAAKRLLGAAQVAWVFGGMGSWNDISVDDRLSADYDELSRALFDVLTRSIVAASNASAPGMR